MPCIDLEEGKVWAVDKPMGWSSFHVVKKLRGAMLARLRRFGSKKLKVGHAGTLDPLASGLMLICIGKATKQIDRLQAGVKEYIADLQLGATTASFDLETPIDGTYPTEHITAELIQEVIPRFVGTISQIPPAYSAVKVDGKRAYKMARCGELPDLKPKTLVITEIEVLQFDPEKMLVQLRIVCSKGTYIRALARDIGEALGSGAHLAGLRRTRVGDFRIEDSLSVDAAVDEIFGSEILLPPAEGDSALRVIPPADRSEGAGASSRSRNERETDGRDILPYSERMALRQNQK